MSFYSAAMAIVENKDGAILMVQEGKEHIEGTWDFPGGGWEDGESITECLKREVLEETGYQIKVKDFLGLYKEKNQRDGTETISFMFTGQLEKKRFDEPPESEEIHELNLRHENRKEIMRKYQEGETYSLNVLWNKLELL